MNTSTLVLNKPNASKLIESLRQLDYTSLTALSDIIDNSLDAGASQIWVHIVPKMNREKGEPGVESIIIADNGCGMDWHTLDEALKLGSDARKNPNCDLGLYGMGLVTASISYGTKVEVITKTADGKCLRSVQDLETIYEKNEFLKILEEGQIDALKYFETFVIKPQKEQPLTERDGKKVPIRNQGTIITISNIDNCQWAYVKPFVDRITTHLGQTYRKFLKSDNVKLYIQGKEVRPIDPIFDHEANILLEEEIPLEDGTIRLVITELKDYGSEINKEKGINISNQGFYVIRNNREILAGQALDIFSKHNDFNLFRAEFNYPGTLDRILSSNFSKNKISLSQSVQDKVSKFCQPFLKQIRNRAKIRQKSNRDPKDNVNFSDIEKYITQKSHLLKRPQAQVEERNAKTQASTKKEQPERKGSPRLDLVKRKRVDYQTLKARFLQKSLGEKGPLYETDIEKDSVLIYWNEDHPFFRIFIEQNKDNVDVLNPISYLVYCLGSAELEAAMGSDSHVIIENIRWDVGRNLSVLLKD
ncbi:hypothetical protein METP3_02901 [Methanosarcinales archaeon]|nr:hypothetical protein METP3_02901 [Methanosarcinales archaeon]